MRSRVVFLLILFAALVAGDSQAQTSGRGHSINGVVLDPSGAAIVGAQVNLKRDGSSLSQTLTDKSGFFRFDSVDLGDYELEVQHEGFRQTRMSMNIGTASRRTVRIVMP